MNSSNIIGRLAPIQPLNSIYFFVLLTLIGLTTPSLAVEEEQALIVPVAEGMRTIRAEALNLETEDWGLVAQAYLEGDEGTVKMRIPEGLKLEELRVTASNDSFMPEGFIESAKTVTWDGDKYNTPTHEGTTVIPRPDPFSAKAVSYSLTEERNLWELDGNVAYFYNTYRGLKLFDMEDAGDPIQLSSVSIVGKGEQMYLHEGTHLALLTTTESFGVKIVSVEDSSVPEIVASIDGFPGAYLDSHKKGDRLWVLTHEYSVWDGDRATLTEIDLSDVNNPVVVDTFEFLISEPLEYPSPNRVGYEVFVQVTSDVFIISNTVNRSFSEVILVDVSGDQEPSLIGRTYTARIRDKFNMRYADGVLTTIGDSYDTYREQFYENMVLETFEIKNDELTALGSLELVKNKNFQASCFYGDQVYVRVLDEVDTLLAVDLSDPKIPTIRGRLDVLGSSVYLERLENGQLLSVGLEDRRVVVSLFDVESAEGMTLVDRVYIGEEGEYTWSENSYLRNGISLFNSEGLVVLPFYHYDSIDSGEISSRAVQLVRFNNEGLDLGGSILHRSAGTRMVSVPDGKFVSLTRNQIATFDLSDVDQPEVVSAVTIFWEADSIFKSKDYLIQLDKTLDYSYPLLLSGFPGDSGVNIPTLLITSMDDTGSVVAELDLPKGSIVGECFKEGILYLMYGNQTHDVETNEYGALIFKLVLVDLKSPERPKLAGSVEVAAGIDTYFNASMEPYWLNAHTLIWASKSSRNELLYRQYSSPLEPLESGHWWGAKVPYSFYRSPDMVILAAEVSDLSAPYLLDVERYQADGSVGIEGVHFSGNKGYFTWGYVEVIEMDEVQDASDVVDNEYWFPSFPMSSYRIEYKHEVVSIDLSDPSNLLFERSLGLNGKLIGVEEHEWGVLLFTSEDRTKYSLPNGSGFGPIEHYWMRAYLHDGVQLLSVDTFDWAVAEGTAPSTYWLRFAEGRAFRPLAVLGDEYTQVIERLNFNSKGWFERGEELDIGGSWIEELYLSDSLLVFGNEEGGYWTGFDDEPLSKTVLEDPVVSGSRSWPLVVPGKGIWKANGVNGVSWWELNSAEEPLKTDVDNESQIAVEWTGIERNTLKLSEVDISDEVGRLTGVQWRFRSKAFKNPDGQAEDVGEGWFESSWFGWYHGGEEGAWIWHLDHGWNFAQGIENGSYEYDRELGWYYAGASLYPYIYTYSPAGWMYYLKETGPTGTRWFYDYRDGKNDWVSFPRSGM